LRQPTRSLPEQTSYLAVGRLQGFVLVLLAALLWSTLGIFYKTLIGTYGLMPLTIAFFRAALSALFLLVALAVFRPRWLRVERRDLPLMVSFGLFGVAAFFFVYVNAIDLVGMAVGAVLLYTAPAWVTIISWRFLGESITSRQGVALALAFVGCALVAGIYDLSQIRVNGLGVLFGLASGLTYGLYSVFNKAGVRKYPPWTVLFYGMLVGAMLLFLVQDLSNVAHALRSPGAVAWLVALALLPTLGSGLAFATGLRFVPVSAASVVANLEPVMAALLAFFILGEVMAGWQMLGGALIVAGAVISSSQA
jgi:DME family drug/metabolite transporter